MSETLDEWNNRMEKEPNTQTPSTNWFIGDHGHYVSHVHEKLDKYGFCETCGERVLVKFAGYDLPDRPNE